MLVDEVLPVDRAHGGPDDLLARDALLRGRGGGVAALALLDHEWRADLAVLARRHRVGHVVAHAVAVRRDGEHALHAVGVRAARAEARVARLVGLLRGLVHVVLGVGRPLLE